MPRQVDVILWGFLALISAVSPLYVLFDVCANAGSIVCRADEFDAGGLQCEADNLEIGRGAVWDAVGGFHADNRPLTDASFIR